MYKVINSGQHLCKNHGTMIYAKYCYKVLLSRLYPVNEDDQLHTKLRNILRGCPLNRSVSFNWDMVANYW